jgi:hypothetical protein
MPKAYVDGRHIGTPIFMIFREKNPHSPLRIAFGIPVAAGTNHQGL